MKNNKSQNIVIKALESILVIGFIIFEELVWNIFAKPIFQYFKNLKLFDALANTFLGVNRYAVLSVFIFILVLAELIGIVSGIMILEGKLLIGLMIYAIKIPIAALTFWLFDLTKDKLMTFHWLKVCYDYVMSLVEKLLNSAVHQYVRSRITVLREVIKDRMHPFLQNKQGFIDRINKHYRQLSSAIKLRLSKSGVSD